MQTTQEQIRDRLNLLPDKQLQEVLLFIDLLLSRVNLRTQVEKSSSFSDALQQFRGRIEAEGSDIPEVDFFQDGRDRSPAPTEARW